MEEFLQVNKIIHMNFPMWSKYTTLFIPVEQKLKKFLLLDTFLIQMIQDFMIFNKTKLQVLNVIQNFISQFKNHNVKSMASLVILLQNFIKISTIQLILKPTLLECTVGSHFISQSRIHLLHTKDRSLRYQFGVTIVLQLFGTNGQ